MYRCKECGTEYKTKVEFCDCGNDTFDFIEDVKPIKKVTPKAKIERKKLTLEQKADLISKLFFVLCIILSIIVWLIPIKTEVKEDQKLNMEEKVTTSIPDINKIWKETPKKNQPLKEQPLKEQQTIVLRENNPIPLTPTPFDYARQFEEKISNTINKTIQKPVEKKIPTQPKILEQKVVNKPIETKKVVSSTQQQASNKNIQTQEAQKPIQPKQQVVEKPNTQAIVQKNQERPVEKPTYNPNSPEMLQYKSNLRAALFSKFAVGSIQGSGSCTVQFSVDSTGKLINRRFVKESDNKSLNDTVYYMLMSVPKFIAPPTGYNGEAITMNFIINNGSYEVSIY